MSLKLPHRVRIDICTCCQLNCRDCYMRHSNYGKVGRGYTKASQFELFIKQNPYIKEIEISNSGEIFLNPDLEEILEIAYKYGVTLTANNGVNFNTAQKKTIEKLVSFQLKSMKISLDGASEDVYKQYRKNGSFQKVIENIKLINAYKKQYNTIYPLLTWQYIIMDTTQDVTEIQAAKSMAHSLGMDISFKKTWNEDFIPDFPEILEKETGLSFSTNSPFLFNWNPCLELWNSPQINWDGRLLGCCCVYLDDFKCNVFELGLENALKTKEVLYAKDLLQGYVSLDSTIDIPCNTCKEFLKMTRKNEFLKVK